MHWIMATGHAILVFLQGSHKAFALYSKCLYLSKVTLKSVSPMCYVTYI